MKWNFQDVVNIGFFLDIGDILGTIDGMERQNVFRKVWERFDIDSKEQKQFFPKSTKRYGETLVCSKGWYAHKNMEK